MSLLGSVPTTSAVSRRPSEPTTLTAPPPPTTWLLVTMWPRSSKTKPEPDARPEPVRTCTETTPGNARAAAPTRSEGTPAGAGAG
jgi:hypothetical protein